MSALKNLAKFTGKHLCQSLFFNKVAGLGNFITENLWTTVSVSKCSVIVKQNMSEKQACILCQPVRAKMQKMRRINL